MQDAADQAVNREEDEKWNQLDFETVNTRYWSANQVAAARCLDRLQDRSSGRVVAVSSP